MSSGCVGALGSVLGLQMCLGGCFVSLDIHMSSRICGFPATVKGLVLCLIGTEEGY